MELNVFKIQRTGLKTRPEVPSKTQKKKKKQNKKKRVTTRIRGLFWNQELDNMGAHLCTGKVSWQWTVANQAAKCSSSGQYIRYREMKRLSITPALVVIRDFSSFWHWECAKWPPLANYSTIVPLKFKSSMILALWRLLSAGKLWHCGAWPSKQAAKVYCVDIVVRQWQSLAGCWRYT